MPELFIVITSLLSLIVIGGLAVLALFGNLLKSLDEWLIVSFGLGGGIIFLQIFGLSCANVRCGTYLMYSLVASNLIVLTIFNYKSLLATFRSDCWNQTVTNSRLITILYIFILLCLIVVTADSLLLPTNNWDAIAIWSYKAKIFYFETISNTGYFSQAYQSYSHPDYPILLPFLQTYIYLMIGYVDDRLVRILHVTYLIMLLLSVNVGLRNVLTDKYRVLVIALLASLPVIMNEAASGCADIPIAFYYTSMIIFTKMWLYTENKKYMMVSAIFTALAINTKNEGLGMLVINSVSLLIFLTLNKRYQIIKSIIYYISSSIVISSPWLLLLSQIKVGQENYVSKISFINIFNGANRLPTILNSFALEFIRTDNWNITWILIITVIIYKIKDISFKVSTYLLVLLICHFAMYVIIYVVTPWDVVKLIDMTMVRLLIHILPLAIIFSASLLGVNQVSYEPEIERSN